jgi:hypothetical protein
MAVLLDRIGRAHRGLHGDQRRRAGRTCTAQAAGAKRRMALLRLFCFAMQSAHRPMVTWAALRQRAAENSRSKAIAGPDRLPQNVASQEGGPRGPFRMENRCATLTGLAVLALS